MALNQFPDFVWRDAAFLGFFHLLILSSVDDAFRAHVVGVDGRFQLGFVLTLQVLAAGTGDHHLELGPRLHGVELQQVDEIGNGR